MYLDPPCFGAFKEITVGRIFTFFLATNPHGYPFDGGGVHIGAMERHIHKNIKISIFSRK